MEDTESPPRNKEINPEWADAIQKAMHDSLIGTVPVTTTNLLENTETPLPHTSGTASPSSVSLTSSDLLQSPFPAFESKNMDTPIMSSPSPRHTFPTPPPVPFKDTRKKRPPKTRRRHQEPEHRSNVEREEKLELLNKLQFYIKERGFQPFRELTIEDPIEDLRYEVFRASRDQDKRRNVKLMQRGLITMSTVLEMVHRQWNPLRLQLDGYSKSMLLTIHDFDDIFEELHWKYCDNMSMPVEAKLFLSIISSIYFFHMSNSNGIPPPMSHDIPTASTPPPPPPQPKMSGPRVHSTSAPPAAPSMPNILSGLSMVQTLLNAQHSLG